MSFAAAARSFAAQSARERSAVFARTTTGGETTPNLRPCDVAGAFTGAAVRVPFKTLKTRRDLEEQGFQLQCDAIALFDRALGIMPTLDSYYRHLDSGIVYHAVQISDPSLAAEIRVALRQLQS